MSDSSDNHLPTVAVVIPAYNIDSYVARAIESALTQTHNADQIIVVDDGSTDNTAERIKQFGSQVQYIHQPNAGLSAARNTGIKAANTEWVAFLDGDDLWLPEKLKLQLELIHRNTHLVWTAANCYVCEGLDGHRVLQRNPENIETILAGKEYFSDYLIDTTLGPIGHPNTMIIKRQTLLDVGLFREGLAYMEDHEMWWRIAYRWPQIGYVNQPLAVYYLMRPGSLSAETACEEKTRHLCSLLNTHLTLAAENNRLAEFKKLSERMLRYSIYPLYRNNQLDEIRILLSRYGHVFSLRQKIALKLMTTILPPSVPYAGEISRKLMGYKILKQNG